MSNVIEMPKIKISGKVLQWEVINADGSIDQSCYRPSDNIITDVGLDMFASGVDSWTLWYTYFCIGTGTTEPSATDTQLASRSYTGTCAYASYDSTTYSTVGSDPYYIYIQRGVQTPLGSLNGTYGEIGFSRASNGSTLFSKHRLKDENGDPTTISISSTQQLRLKYVVVLCISPSTSTTGTININGLGNIDYEAKWQSTVLTYILRSFNMTDLNVRMSSLHSDFTFTDIGTSPSLPAYTNETSFIRQYISDTPGYAEVHSTSTWSVDVANGTWYGVSAPAGNIKNFLIKFTTPFVKANTHIMKFTIKTTIGRS